MQSNISKDQLVVELLITKLSMQSNITNLCYDAIENNPKIIIMNWISRQIVLAMYKVEDEMFDDLTSINIINFDTYIKYKGLRLF